jgi:hypothetical protein
MRYFIGLFCVAICFTAANLRAEDKPDPRENLDTTIAELTRLLEKKDYETLLRKFVAPRDLEQITTKLPFPDFAKSFGENKAETLLKVLAAVKDKSPTLSDDKAVATFEFKEAINGKRDIKFQKVDKLWYIKN